MKIVIFYSWQSDLPNNKNRGLIGDCIQKVSKQLLEVCPQVTEIEIEMDSRNESGTPDLVDSIFRKIDSCDIFLADISIINSATIERYTPNPNVLIELGYASRVLDWSKILCIFNSEYGKVEDLPFDIRFRKPIIYNSSENTSISKKQLTKLLKDSIENIINTRIIDKKEYLTTKRTVDLHVQSILIDFCRLLFETDEDKNHHRFNYPKLLQISLDEIASILEKKQILGFHFYKNIGLNISDLVEFFNDGLETFFLSDKEKRLLAKMVFSLREYKELIYSERVFDEIGECSKYKLVSGYEMNPTNSPDSYLLLQPLKGNKAVVISGGEFDQEVTKKLLLNLRIKKESLQYISKCIHQISLLTNEWISLTGNYFIANPNLFN
ncbi:TPA: hypothetical protein ACGOYK_000519 [Streptococcus suis]